MILNAIAEKLKCPSGDDFKSRPFEAWLIVQTVAWYLRYPLPRDANKSGIDVLFVAESSKKKAPCFRLFGQFVDVAVEGEVAVDLDAINL